MVFYLFRGITKSDSIIIQSQECLYLPCNPFKRLPGENTSSGPVMWGPSKEAAHVDEGR